MIDSRTQSVCGERFNKHVNMVCNLEKGHSHMHHFEPVAGPASTGEPPPDSVKLVGTRQPTEAEIEYGKTLDPMAKECLERNKAKMERAARPSEPSAPQTGYCPSHGEKLIPIFGGKWNGCPKCPRDADGFTPAAPRQSAIEIAGERDLKVITEPIDWEAVENDAAPQTSTEPQHVNNQTLDTSVVDRLDASINAAVEYMTRKQAAAPQPVSGDAPGVKVTVYDPIAYLQELYADMGKRGECEICLKLQFCIEVLKEKLAESAPSVSTEQEQSALELHRAANNFGARVKERNPSWFTEERGSTDFAEARDRLTTALLNYSNFAAKTAAAPSVAGTQPTQTKEEYEAYRQHNWDWNLPKWEDLAKSGAAQGTPQVEGTPEPPKCLVCKLPKLTVHGAVPSGVAIYDLPKYFCNCVDGGSWGLSNLPPDQMKAHSGGREPFIVVNPGHKRECASNLRIAVTQGINSGCCPSIGQDSKPVYVPIPECNCGSAQPGDAPQKEKP